jgi:hypothetical protein
MINKATNQIELQDVYYIAIDRWIKPEMACKQLNISLEEYVKKIESYGASFVLNSSHVGFGFYTEEQAQKFINEVVIPLNIMERLRRAK